MRQDIAWLLRAPAANIPRYPSGRSHSSTGRRLSLGWMRNARTPSLASSPIWPAGSVPRGSMTAVPTKTPGFFAIMSSMYEFSNP